MSNKKNINLADVSKLNIMKFTLPIIATSFLQQLFNSADSAIVGRFVSHQALAAVGGNATVINLLINLFNGLAIGANVVVARKLGEKKYKDVSESIFSIMVLAFVCGIIVGIFGFFVARPLLVLIDTPYDIVDLAAQYLKIYFYGMPFVMMFNFGSAILRSNGETKKPLLALIVSGIVNIILNIYFVVVLKLSVTGVALATVISNAVCSLVVVFDLLRRNDYLKLSLKNQKISKEAIGLTTKVGLPAGLQSSVFSLSNVVILSAINSFGSSAVAGSTTSVSYELFSYFFTFAFTQASVSFVSHNYGAKNIDNCKKAYKNCLILALIWETSFDLLLFLFRYPAVKVFTTDPQVIEFALTRMSLALFIHFMVGSYEIAGGCLRGFGKSIIPATISLICCCGIRLIWVFFILPLHRSFFFLFLAYPISWVFCGIAVTTAYHIELKKIEQQVSLSQS